MFGTSCVAQWPCFCLSLDKITKGPIIVSIIRVTIPACPPLLFLTSEMKEYGGKTDTYFSICLNKEIEQL